MEGNVALVYEPQRLTNNVRGQLSEVTSSILTDPSNNFFEKLLIDWTNN